MGNELAGSLGCARNLTLCSEDVDADKLSAHHGGLARMKHPLSALRSRLLKHISHRLEPPAFGLVGEDTQLSDGLRRDFQVYGLYHLLSVAQ